MRSSNSLISPIFAALLLCSGSACQSQEPASTHSSGETMTSSLSKTVQGIGGTLSGPALSLKGTNLDASALQRVVQDPGAAALTSIDVSSNPTLGDGGLKALAASPHLANLKALRADGIGATDAGASALANAASLKPEQLYLRDNAIGDKGLSALAGSPALSRATILHLRANPIGDAGAQALAASPHLSALDDLSLSGSRIGLDGARALFSSTTLTKLDALDLATCPIPAEALEPLADPAHLPALTTLYLSGLALPDDLANKLKAARPKLKLL